MVEKSFQDVAYYSTTASEGVTQETRRGCTRWAPAANGSKARPGANPGAEPSPTPL